MSANRRTDERTGRQTHWYVRHSSAGRISRTPVQCTLTFSGRITRNFNEGAVRIMLRAALESEISYYV